MGGGGWGGGIRSECVLVSWPLLMNVFVRMKQFNVRALCKARTHGSWCTGGKVSFVKIFCPLFDYRRVITTVVVSEPVFWEVWWVLSQCLSQCTSV